MTSLTLSSKSVLISILIKSSAPKFSFKNLSISFEKLSNYVLISVKISSYGNISKSVGFISSIRALNLSLQLSAAQSLNYLKCSQAFLKSESYSVLLIDLN